MEGARSVPGLFAGFIFWLGIAYFFYWRDFAGALWFVLVAGAVCALWLFLSRLRVARPGSRLARGEGAASPPRSSLPDYDFKNADPKDFE